MTTAKKLLSVAAAELGTSESPPNSNRVKYNTAFYGREVSGSAYPWCCAFVWWCFTEAGAPELFYGGGKTAGCTTLMTYHKNAGQFITSGYRPGDLVLYNWSGNSSIAEHIGIVETIIDSRTLTAIEGNTSVASNDNGGNVMRRRRTSDYIIGAIRPAYETEEEIDMTLNELTSLVDTGDEHSEWADEAIELLVSAGIFNGDGNGNYGWRKPITREALAKVLFETVKKLGFLDRLE